MTCENEDINGEKGQDPRWHSVRTEMGSSGIYRDGGYAEYATLRTEAMVSVPADMDPCEAAPLLCAGITVFSKFHGASGCME